MSPDHIHSIRLRDGSELQVRPIRAEDEGLLQDTFSRMSERSVYFRFFSPLKRLPDSLAHRLSHVDYSDRVALVATGQAGAEGSNQRILGVARYDRIPGTDIAEVAVAVVDEYQRRGLGSGLLTALAKVAAEHGIATFTLIVLPENQSMFKLLRSLGWVHDSTLVHGVYEITFPLGSGSE